MVYPPDGTIYAGRFAGLGRDGRAYLHLMYSVGDSAALSLAKKDSAGAPSRQDPMQAREMKEPVDSSRSPG